MRQYETIFIADPDFEEEAVKELTEKFKSLIEDQGGQVTEVEEWGKRKLAYPIKNRREGCYILMNFSAEPKTVQDLDRVYKITNGVLRHLIVKKEK